MLARTACCQIVGFIMLLATCKSDRNLCAFHTSEDRSPGVLCGQHIQGSRITVLAPHKRKLEKGIDPNSWTPEVRSWHDLQASRRTVLAPVLCSSANC